MNRRRTKLVPKIKPTTVEAELRAAIEKGVDVFGFDGVLSILADEASERVNDEDDSTQAILDVIETAIEEIEGSEEDDDADEDFDEEESDDDADEEEDNEEE